MAVDSALYIGNFDTAKPAGSDPAAELDNSDRQIKTAAKNTFPNCTGGVTASHTELSYVTGVTSPIQTQLNAKAALASPTFTGTPAAPTATLGTATTQLATTAFTQAAIASVNAQSPLTLAIDSGAAVAGAVGQHTVCTNAAAVTFTLPAMTAGQRCRVTFANNVSTNLVDPNGQPVFGAAGTRQANLIGTSVEFTYVNSSVGVVY